MLGKATEIHLQICTSIGEYVDFQRKRPDAEIIEMKFGMLPQSVSFQQSFGILIIYKEGESQ